MFMSYRMYGSPASTSGPLDVGTAIRETTQDFCTAFNTGNYDHCASLFTPDGYFMPPNHELAAGTKAIERVLQHFADLGYQDLRLETIRVEHSGDMAVELGRYTLSIRRENGTTVVDRGKYLNAWHRFGAWLLLADCWSSDIPVMADTAHERQLQHSEDPEIVASDIQRSA
jgi:uncharacterized protein (TIGR02246 family)